MDERERELFMIGVGMMVGLGIALLWVIFNG